ncbi:hypothetical protein T4B_12004 [Trichinella pseudospiralis]|uniref:Reverse transcriptase RNase H-like domain-containing protein n=1 Tax=Trichinella pseudospiralis TaxID=6337 RepID=A0A0V1EDH9_TRIPS|nr:hypothetical protein T4A_11814 [Trichinella pseudospiralis]KRZ27959.1 hypothetical protein T4B_12004 [Trichinella pseudospiralis]
MTAVLEFVVVTSVAEDLHQKGRIFARLYLAQLLVDEALAELQTIITHKRVFKLKRFQFSITSLPHIFQRFRDSQCELIKVLREVFNRLHDAKIHLKREKCVFRSNSGSSRALRRLLDSGVPWKFRNAGPLTLTCDASLHGVECVLAHKLPCGWEAPIAFHSKTLSMAEQKLQVEIRTDYKPLFGLLENSIQTAVSMSLRMTRWSILLTAYHYNFIYYPGLKVGTPTQVMSTPTITKPQVAEITGKGAVLVHAQNWMHKGWPTEPINKEVKPAERQRDEFLRRTDCPNAMARFNGTAFKSAEFLGFLKSNSIHHVTTITKEDLKRRSTGRLRGRLAHLLLSQHTTADSKLNISPAELHTKRKLGTCLGQILLNNAKSAEREVTSPRREFKISQVLQDVTIK